MIDRYTRPEMAALWTKQKKFETWLEVELNATDAWVKLLSLIHISEPTRRS